jgi:regulatory protein
LAGTITALTIQKRNKERVNVFVDGEFALAVTVMVAARFSKGQQLSDADIEQLKRGDERDKAYHQAIRFLGFRPRSRSEIVSYLRKKAYTADVIDDTVNRLLEQQYLDDEAFARFWLENREQFRPRGIRALRYELKQKGIADAVIDKVLSDLDEHELAWAAVENKLYYWRNLPEETLKKKMMGFLSRRGFSYEVVNDTFERALDSLDL